MRLTLGFLAGIALTIGCAAIWKPAIGWAFSRGDG